MEFSWADCFAFAMIRATAEEFIVMAATMLRCGDRAAVALRKRVEVLIFAAVKSIAADWARGNAGTASDAGAASNAVSAESLAQGCIRFRAPPVGAVMKPPAE